MRFTNPDQLTFNLKNCSPYPPNNYEGELLFISSIKNVNILVYCHFSVETEIQVVGPPLSFLFVSTFIQNDIPKIRLFSCDGLISCKGLFSCEGFFSIRIICPVKDHLLVMDYFLMKDCVSCINCLQLVNLI